MYPQTYLKYEGNTICPAILACIGIDWHDIMKFEWTWNNQDCFVLEIQRVYVVIQRQEAR